MWLPVVASDEEIVYTKRAEGFEGGGAMGNLTGLTSGLYLLGMINFLSDMVGGR
jgi:hypothetical protein